MTPDDFSRLRPGLVHQAYRMLGEVQRAEDIVQEAGLRAFQREVHHPGAWLRQVVSRLCLDELKSARARRETYPGPWLPEPWVNQEPESDAILNESMHMATMLVLETLTPAQRVAFVLREVLDEDYGDIAATMGISADSVRQHVTRARRRLKEDRPPLSAAPMEHMALLGQLAAAMQSGDALSLQSLLCADVVGLSDGGGKVNAARVPIHGPQRMARTWTGLLRLTPPGFGYAPAWVNGLPGVLGGHDGVITSVLAFGLRDGKLARIWTVLNPDKLAHLRQRTPDFAVLQPS